LPDGGSELISTQLTDLFEEAGNVVDQDDIIANPEWAICDDDTIVIDYTFDTDAINPADDGITFEAKVMGWVTADDDFTVTITED